MDAHEEIDRITARKEYDKSKESLIKMAEEDINLFIIHCQAKGFRTGVQVGFLVGAFITLFIYLLLK